MTPPCPTTKRPPLSQECIEARINLRVAKLRERHGRRHKGGDPHRSAGEIAGSILCTVGGRRVALFSMDSRREPDPHMAIKRTAAGTAIAAAPAIICYSYST